MTAQNDIRPRNDVSGANAWIPRNLQSATFSSGSSEDATIQPLPGWPVLFGERGRTALTALHRTLTGNDHHSPAVLSRLRTQGFTPEEAAAILTQYEIQRSAQKKFGTDAQQLLFTRAGLEQATRHQVAGTHAARFRAADCTTVADLGCGIGAESLALLSAGITPLAVERDPFTAAIAANNLHARANALGVAPPSVHIADAETFPLTHCDGVFFDPARRTAGHSDTRRLTSADDYSPSLAFAFDTARRHPTGIKLGPGFDRDRIPEDAEAQWVSVQGQLVEMALWFGGTARQGVRRAALVFAADSTHAELTAPSDAPDAAAHPLGEYLYEPDNAVIRARLIGLLAEHLNAGMCDTSIAYLTTDVLTHTPFAQAFRIVEELPAKEKELRKALQARDIGTLEIKKRGANVDPAQLRQRLKLRGSTSATLVMTRVAGKHTALLAERISALPTSSTSTSTSTSTAA